MICATKGKYMTTQQIEMTFANGQDCPLRLNRRPRAGRAAWWFTQMRRAVDAAMDWQPAPQPRGEQSWLDMQNFRPSA